MKSLTVITFLLLSLMPPCGCSNTDRLEYWVELSQGTAVNVKMNEILDFEQITEGQMINCKAFGSVTVNQAVLIRHDELAYARVLEVHRKKHKTTEIIIEVQGVKAIDGQQVSLFSPYFTLNLQEDSNTIGRSMTAFVKNNIKIEA